jgi:hypothetical protein
MPFHRNPKGVYVRTSPDLWQDNCAWGWEAGQSTGSGFADAGIENLDNAGRTMLVWGVVASMYFDNLTPHPTGTMGLGFIKGHEDALSLATLTPLSPLAGEFNANVWDTPTGNGLDARYTLMQILSGPGEVSIFPPYPIAAVPTTWSIAIDLEWVAGASSIDWAIGWFVEFVGPQP